MNPSALESKIRELAAAGQIVGHHHDCDHVRDGADECTCGTVEHDAAVEQALAEALAELKLLASNLPKWDCAGCRRTECPHSGRFPQRPGPKDGCSSFKGGI